MEEELQHEFDTRVEAERQGKKFIKLRLNRKEVRRAAGVGVRFTGVRVVQGYPGGTDRDGFPIIEIVEKGGSITFKMDPNTREYIAYMLDDEWKSLYAENGYNRDLIASHIYNKAFEDQPFYVETKGIMPDIQKRLKAIEKILGDKEKKKRDTDAQSLVNINAQMEELKEKQAQLLDSQNLSIPKGELSAAAPNISPDKVPVNA